MSTLLLNRRNTPVSTRLSVDGDQLKITLVYTVIHAIFLNTYIAIHKGFFGLSEPGRVRQGIGLWYFSKLRGCLLFNRYFLTENMLDLFFPKLSNPVTYPYQILAILIRLLTDKHTQSYNLIYSKRFSVNATKMRSFLRFYSFTVRYLGTLYTFAKSLHGLTESTVLTSYVYIS